MAARGDYFRFGFYLKNNPTEIKKKNRNRFKPTGFGSIILEQKPKPKPVQSDRFRFDYFRAKTKTQPIDSVFFQFGFVINFGLVFQFQAYETEPVSFLKYSNRFYLFFFHGSVFLFIFFQFSRFFIFLLTPNGHATKPKDIGFSCLARSKIDGSGWAVRPNLFLKCFGSGSATPNNIGSCWAGGPNAIGSFWKCFGPG
jgi:hypothetical protein